VFDTAERLRASALARPVQAFYALDAVRSRETEDWMTFTFQLVRTDGTPADPPSMRSAVPDMRPGDTIPRRPGKTLRVVGVRVDEADQPTMLIVEDTPERASSDAA
jgi:hypothetical protein